MIENVYFAAGFFWRNSIKLSQRREFILPNPKNNRQNTINSKKDYYFCAIKIVKRKNKNLHQ